MKNCEDIGQWIEPIRNHFWHCCQSCDSNAEKLKVGKIVWQKYRDSFCISWHCNKYKYLVDLALILPPDLMIVERHTVKLFLINVKYKQRKEYKMTKFHFLGADRKKSRPWDKMAIESTCDLQFHHSCKTLLSIVIKTFAKYYLLDEFSTYN